MSKIFQKLPKNLLFIVVSLVIITGIFATGFHFGNNSSFGNNSVLAGERADLSTFWKAWDLLDKKFVPADSSEATLSEDRIYGAIQGMVNSLGDPYTVFLPPVENEELNESLTGNFTGVGMEVGINEGRLQVIAPLKNTPAEKAGMMPEDIILQIDKTATSGLSLDEAVSLIRGEAGTSVEFIIARKGESGPLTISIERANIKTPVLESYLRDDGVFVIELFSFNADSETMFRKALREFLLSKSNKLILDLRGNPGGFLDSAVDISSWFLPAGKTIVAEDFGEGKDKKTFRSKGFNIFNDNLKMVILVNAGSASASEIVAGALQDHKKATLVGTNTFGKGSVQELIKITEDTSLKVTIARWVTPEGVSISNGGLKPDVVIEQSKEDSENKIDTQLEKAVEILLRN